MKGLNARLREMARRSALAQTVLRLPGLRATQQALSVARQLQSPIHYLRGELSGSARRSHRLRKSGFLIEQRHRADRQVLYEVFALGVYDPPPEAAAALAAAQRPRKVVDLGANIGCFTLRALELLEDSRVVAVEADAANAALLVSMVESNALRERVEIVHAAAAVSNGEATIRSGLYQNSYVTDDGPGERVLAKDAFELMADAAFIKIDIEGSEWPLILDPRLKELGAAVLTMEWHGTRGGVTNPEQTAVKMLQEAGFCVRSHAQSAEAVGQIWAWRPPQ